MPMATALPTFQEVMINKTRGFEDGDQNDDGLLSFEEMVDEVRVEWERTMKKAEANHSGSQHRGRGRRRLAHPGRL